MPLLSSDSYKITFMYCAELNYSSTAAAFFTLLCSVYEPIVCKVSRFSTIHLAPFKLQIGGWCDINNSASPLPERYHTLWRYHFLDLYGFFLACYSLDLVNLFTKAWLDLHWNTQCLMWSLVVAKGINQYWVVSGMIGATTANQHSGRLSTSKENPRSISTEHPSLANGSSTYIDVGFCFLNWV